MKEFFRRLRYFLHRRRLDDELADEMEFHREMAAREGGANFGNPLLLREEAREAWGWTWVDRFFQDLRYGIRMLRKSPGFTLAAVLMLAIGIGVNVAVFGFFDLMVLRPLDVRDPDTLLRFHRRSPESFAYALPYPEAAFFREYSKSLSAVLVLNPTRVAIEGEDKPLMAHFVSVNLFSELGANAKVGRVLDPAQDGASDAAPLAVLGHGFWQRHFGADPLVIGKAIRVNGKLVTIVGVAPKEFSGLSMDEPALWAPVTQQPYFVTGSHLLTDFSADTGVQMWGRLQPGTTPKAAEEELRALAAEMRRQHPNDIWEKESLPSEPGGYAKSLRMGNRRGTGSEGTDQMVPVFALVGALGLLILAVACGNLGSLLLARGVAREREIAIRVSVGAGSGRLVRQLFTESLLLALLGAAAGLGLGYAVLRYLMVWTGAPSWLNPVPDWPVIVFAVGIGFAAAILFGLTPALQLARQRHRASVLRQLLIGGQVAASCVLLIVSGLLVRALDRAMSMHPGFEYEHVVSIEPNLAAHGYSPTQARAYLDTLRSRILAVPGVASVSLSLTPPLGRGSITSGVEIDGHRFDIQIHRVAPEFFQTMKIPLLAGRNLTPGDPLSIVVSQSFAQGLWPGQSPLGKHFAMDKDSAGRLVNYTIVGLTGSARLIKPEDPDMVEAYFLAGPNELPSMSMVVRTSAPPEGLPPVVVTSLARAIDPQIFPEVQTMKSSFQQKMRATERGVVAVTVLGLSALLLACLGIVGLVAYAVSQRTKEIGIRMALGAKPAHVLGIVLHQFSRPVVFGLLIGVGGAGALSQLLRRQLYGVNNLDPAAYVAAIGVFLITAAVAALLPARKALRVDPMRALRYE